MKMKINAANNQEKKDYPSAREQIISNKRSCGSQFAEEGTYNMKCGIELSDNEKSMFFQMFNSLPESYTKLSESCIILSRSIIKLAKK